MDKRTYYNYIISNQLELLKKYDILTLSQFDDLYAGTFGVWGNIGKGKKPEFIEELSPNKLPHSSEEVVKRLYEFHGMILGVIMSKYTYEMYIDEFTFNEQDLHKFIKVNEHTTILSIRDTLIAKLEKENDKV